MPGTVDWLPDQPGTVTDLPVFGSESPMRKVTEGVAFDDAWDRTRRDKIRDLFDGMAADWGSRFSEERDAAVQDALDRGGAEGGTVVELGAGSGLATARLVERFGSVVAFDLSMEMLRHQPGTVPRVRADASVLPLPTGIVDTLVMVNMLLFPVEVDRVLTDSGTVLWVNTNGHETPIHLAPEAVVAALPGDWTALAGRAGTGLWAAVRRA